MIEDMDLLAFGPSDWGELQLARLIDRECRQPASKSHIDAMRNNAYLRSAKYDEPEFVDVNLNLTKILEVTDTTKIVYDGRRRSKAMGFMDDYDGMTADAPSVAVGRVRRDRYTLAHPVAFKLYNEMLSRGFSIQQANYVVSNQFASLSSAVEDGRISPGEGATAFHVGVIFYGEGGRMLHLSGTVSQCVSKYMEELAASAEAFGAVSYSDNRVRAAVPVALSLFNATDAYRQINERLSPDRSEI